MASRHWMCNFFCGSSSSFNIHGEDLRQLRLLLEDLPDNADDRLIHFFHSNKNTNQGQPGTKPAFLERAKPWVQTLRNMAIDKDLTKTASEALKIIGTSNSVLGALLFVGVALERILAMNPNEEKCLQLLAMMGTTVISLRDMRKYFHHINKNVLKNALQIVLENCILCCDYLDGSMISKIWNAKSMEGQILEAQQRLDTILASVNCAGIVELQQRNNYYVVPIDNILETKSPVGLEKPIEKVCELLSMNEKHMQAIAVIISGLGGMGKTTLASASIERLAPSITDFKFSRVIFDNTGSMESGRLSHIKMLQQQLVNNLTGTKQEFGNTADGRSKLKEVLQNNSAFIFIDNVNFIDDVEQLLPKSLVLNYGTSLRILITSRDRDVRVKVPRNCRAEEYQIQPLCSEDAQELLYKTVMDSLDDQGKENFPGEVQKLKEVGELCCGIPILLHLIGTHLRDGRSLECYNQIIEELQKGDLVSYSCSYEPIPDILLFVYEGMKVHLQIAFLDICSGRLWKSGLYSMLQLRDWESDSLMIGENALESLLKKGLVQKKEEKLIVHDILMTMMLDEINKYSIWNIANKKAIKGIEKYVTYDKVNEVDCEDLDLLHSSLRFLCIHFCSHVKNKCQATFVELRGLSVYASALPFTSLEGFTNMAKLEFAFCHELTELPSGICSLRRLTILSVYHCDELVSFPNDLRSLTSLKVLSITGCFQLKGLLDGKNMPQHLKFLKIFNCRNMRFPKDLAYLSYLEECYLEYLSIEEDDDAMVPFKFPSTSSLKKLVLCDGTLRTLEGDFDKLQNLRELTVYSNYLTNLPVQLCRSATKLKILNLSGLRLNSLPDEISLLTELHTLDFFACSQVHSTTFQPLTSLSTLRARGMTDFTPQLCSCLVNLEELEFQDCSEEMENLPGNINMLFKLKTLRFNNCPGLKNLPQSITILSALQKLHLKNCPKLKSLPKDIGMLPNLNTLFLSYCSELKTLPESTGMLSTLSELSISETGISTLPGNLSNLLSLDLNDIPIMEFPLINLRNLVRLNLNQIPIVEFPSMFCSSLQNLQELSIVNCVELVSLPNDLCMLTNLLVLSCENIKIKALPQGFTNLRTLRWLELSKCGGLLEDAMDIILQLKNLKWLWIEDSNALICRWRYLQSSQGIPQSNKISVDVGHLVSYLWRRALHLWRMDCIRKYHSDRLQKEGTL